MKQQAGPARIALRQAHLDWQFTGNLGVAQVFIGDEGNRGMAGAVQPDEPDAVGAFDMAVRKEPRIVQQRGCIRHRPTLMACAGSAQAACQTGRQCNTRCGVTDDATTALPATAEQLNRHALTALREGRFDEAVRGFRAALALDPRAAPLWHNLAHACRLNADDEGEAAALDRALAIDQRDLLAHVRRAQLLQRCNDESGAFAAWSAVRQLTQNGPPLAPAMADQIAAGLAYFAALEQRLTGRVEQAMGQPDAALDPAEQRRIAAFVDTALGRRRTYTNVCAGLHYPFLPADEFFDRHHFPWFAQLEAEAPAIRRELHALLDDGDSALRPYVRMSEGAPANVWSALDGSLDWGACFLWEYGVANQPVLDKCPRTAAALAAVPGTMLPGRAPNAFFSLLKPHTRIPPHTGVTNTRAIVHLALDIPPDCGFRVGGETRQWVAGQAFAFDDTIEHEAWNRSDQRRAVLILDCWNPHLSDHERAAIARYCAVLDDTMPRALGRI